MLFHQSAMAAAFAPTPALNALRPSLRTPACSSLRMSANEVLQGQEGGGIPDSTAQDDQPKDLSKGNDFISIIIDSVKRLFKKSEDDYPPGEGQGFTMTPKTPQRNKGDWGEGK